MTSHMVADTSLKHLLLLLHLALPSTSLLYSSTHTAWHLSGATVSFLKVCAVVQRLCSSSFLGRSHGGLRCVVCPHHDNAVFFSVGGKVCTEGMLSCCYDGFFAVGDADALERCHCEFISRGDHSGYCDSCFNTAVVSIFLILAMSELRDKR